MIASTLSGFVDPAITSEFWFSRGSAPLEEGRTVTWWWDMYGVSAQVKVVALEPAAGAVQGAVRLFDFPGARLSMVLGSALAVPFAAHRFDAALLLGVLSVVDPPTTALDEARRVGRRLGVWDYCSTTGSPVHAGGSRFPTPSELARWLAATGWQVVGTLDQLGEPPAEWRAGADVSPDDVPDEAVESEAEVVAAIESGRLEPRVLVARRVEDR